MVSPKSKSHGKSSKAEYKTKPTRKNPDNFLRQIDHEKKREEAFQLLELFKSVTKMEPKMWGNYIVGFGKYHYRYESGREGDFLVTGFSPRKTKHSIYLLSGFSELQDELAQLGKYKTGSSCLYINKLEDVDMKILKKMIQKSLKIMKK